MAKYILKDIAVMIPVLVTMNHIGDLSPNDTYRLRHRVQPPKTIVREFVLVNSHPPGSMLSTQRPAGQPLCAEAIRLQAR